VAKRRNLKKEKALRNQAYARHFRKKTNSTYSRDRDSKHYSNKDQKNDSENSEASDSNFD
jgi:hypothetical protein